MENAILLVGLDLTGQSIGLALQKAGVQAPRIGYDSDGAAARQAKEVGAVDRIENRLGAAAGESSLVLVSVPASILPATLADLASVLSADTVVLDASPLKQTANESIQALRAAGVHYIGLTAAVGGDRLRAGEGGQAGASADRFRNGVLGVILPSGTPQEALDLALQLGAILGATPYFLEAGEADAATILTEELPGLVSTALMRAAVQETAWREVRRTGGPSFVDMVALGLARPAREMAHVAAVARPSTLERIDHLILALQEIRSLVADGDEAGLTRLVDESASALTQWLQARSSTDWGLDEVGSPPVPPREPAFARLFGLRRPAPRR
jgi:prephenate dehydrogenase